MIFALSISVKAQFRVYHKLGGSIGPTLISGDWGRNTNIGNVFGYGGVEINFLHNMQVARSRFSLKSNLGYSFIKNKHNKDEWTGAGSEKPSNEQNKLAGMSGSTSTVSLGTQVEYNFFDFGLYYPRASWTPYISVGFNMLFYNNNFSISEYGVPYAYGEEGIYNGKGLTTSIKGSLGVKYRVSRFLNIFSELTFQRAYSDKLDGLIPEASFGTDYISGLNIGVMYYIKN